MVGNDELSTVRGLAERLDEVQVLDIREPEEWAAGRIDGSIHLPLASLMGGADPGLDPARPVVAVCRSGARSEVAALMLRARGLDAYNLLDGLEAWQAEGRPLTTPDGAPGRVA